MSVRKPYNDKAGYIASLRSGKDRGWVVIYEAEKQNMGLAGGRYAVVCETHHAVVNVRTIPLARSAMKAVDFCEACQEAA